MRPAVGAYYLFARTCDDIADNFDLAAERKLLLLDEMERDLLRAQGHPIAVEAANQMAARGIPLSHAADLLVAFRRDARNPVCKDFGDLMDYCRFSAVPVGRFLLALCGETSREADDASDKLCAALQILNHVQDCGRDRRELRRVYLPMDWLQEAGADPEMLDLDRTTGQLRVVIDRLLDESDGLLASAQTLPHHIRSSRLRMQAAATLSVAHALSVRLRRRDPLHTRIKPSRRDWAVAFVIGLRHGAKR